MQPFSTTAQATRCPCWESIWWTNVGLRGSLGLWKGPLEWKIIKCSIQVLVSTYGILDKPSSFGVLVNSGVGEMISEEFSSSIALWCYRREVSSRWMNKYKSALDSKMYLVNERYKNHPVKCTHNMLKGTGCWRGLTSDAIACWHHLLFGLWHLTCPATHVVFQIWGIKPKAKTSCGHRALSPKRLGQELFDKSPPAMEIREPSSDWFYFLKTKLKI